MDGAHAAPLDVVVPGLNHPAADIANARAVEIVDAVDFAIRFKSACPNAKAARHRMRGHLMEAVLCAYAAVMFQEEFEKNVDETSNR